MGVNNLYTTDPDDPTDTRKQEYAQAGAALSRHVETCERGCRGGTGWDLCPTGEEGLDRLLDICLPDGAAYLDAIERSSEYEALCLVMEDPDERIEATDMTGRRAVS